jgi:hypothetical protein
LFALSKFCGVVLILRQTDPTQQILVATFLFGEEVGLVGRVRIFCFVRDGGSLPNLTIFGIQIVDASLLDFGIGLRLPLGIRISLANTLWKI